MEKDVMTLLNEQRCELFRCHTVRALVLICGLTSAVFAGRGAFAANAPSDLLYIAAVDNTRLLDKANLVTPLPDIEKMRSTVTIVNGATKETLGYIPIPRSPSAMPIGAPISLVGSFMVSNVPMTYIFVSATETDGSSTTSHIYKITADGTATTPLVPSAAIPGTINSMIISGDSKTLYYGYDGGIASCDATGSTTMPVSAAFMYPPANSRVLSVTADQTALYFGKALPTTVTASDGLYCMKSAMDGTQLKFDDSAVFSCQWPGRYHGETGSAGPTGSCQCRSFCQNFNALCRLHEAV